MRAIASGPAPLLALAGLLAGCQDYNLQGSSDEKGKYNPPDLTTEKQVDRITQVTIPAVDVLWVIDNSCSMEEEQRSLRTNFPQFMSYFTNSGLDYHVGVVSTDMRSRQHSGKLQPDSNPQNGRYIDTSYSEDEAVESFSDRASLGTGGDSDEKGKDAAWAALVTESVQGGTNEGFFRDEASLSVVVISDEIDYSRIDTDEFIQWMLTVKGEPGMTTFSSIVGLTRNDCGSTERGTGYLEVTDAVGGIAWSICTDDWSGLLTELGLQAAGLKREFYLSLVPVEESISVTVEATDGSVETFTPGTDWTYTRTRNSITFAEYVPDPLAVVHIEYDVLASAQVSGTGEGAEDTAAEE